MAVSPATGESVCMGGIVVAAVLGVTLPGILVGSVWTGGCVNCIGGAVEFCGGIDDAGLKGAEVEALLFVGGNGKGDVEVSCGGGKVVVVLTGTFVKIVPDVGDNVP